MSDSGLETTLDEIEVVLEQEVKPERPYFFQLDVLKAIAIAFVVMTIVCIGTLKEQWVAYSGRDSQSHFS